MNRAPGGARPGGGRGDARLTSRAMNRAAPPPDPPSRPHPIDSVAGTRLDEYFWMRDDDRTDPEVLAHLAAENAYADAVLAPLAGLRERLFREMVARLQPDDGSVPYRKRGYMHYRRYRAGGEYPLVLRRRIEASSAEEVVLDIEALARGHEFYQVNGCFVSPDDRLVAFTEDVTGRRLHTLRFLDLTSGAWLDDRVPGTASAVAWLADSRRIAYVEKDPETLNGIRLRCHRLGCDPASDPVLYEESDDSFSLSVCSTKDERYVLLSAANWSTTEWRYFAAADAKTPQLRLFLQRQTGHEYEPEHIDGRWLVRTNWCAPNFRLMEVACGLEAGRGAWRDVVAHRDDTFIHDFEVFRDFVVLEEQHAAQRRLRVHRWSGEEFVVEGDDPVATFELDANEEVDTDVLRYVRTSSILPDTTCDLDMRSRSVTIRKRETVHGFDAALYVAERLWASARDGERVPVTVTHRRDTPLDGTAPLLVHGYGAYGVCEDPVFSSTLVSLIDRGFVHAVAHVRGGQELGRRWFDAGRVLAKMNSFTDFIDVTRHLLETGRGDPARVFATGGSAGGLLVAGVANMMPELFRGIVALVPFVDVLTTMLDETVPLTTLEYDIWGDPRDRRVHDCIAGYSPYDNVRAVCYPAIYAATGLWDSQVQYYEPAKWVARLRRRMTGGGPVLLRVDLDAGHGGKSGRYRHLHEIAEQQGFLLDLAGMGLSDEKQEV